MKCLTLKKRTLLGVLFLFIFSLMLLKTLEARVFTIEEILSSPFPSNLVASPQGDLVAWVFNIQGKRNIWIARAPEFKAQQLTQYSSDDGQELGGLAFNSDGSVIVFVRGGSANRAGEYPNPTSNPEGTEEAIWAIKVSGGESWRIGEGNSPVISPSGNFVAYNLRGRIFIASLEEASKPQLLFKARGTCRSHVFSPDGKRLAFVSSREDHSYIGIYDLDKKSILWISPSVDRDAYPAWPEDGKRIAFFRFPGTTAGQPFSDGQSFSLMQADTENGKAREVWRSPDESGGFAQSSPSRPLFWAAKGRILFYSEHEGWIHIYSVSPDEEKIQCLTPGEFEVEDCCLSPDRETLVFSSNSSDIDRRHLFSVSTSGGKAEPLTSGKGIEWAPVVTASGNYVVFLSSTANQPAAPSIMSKQGKERRLIAPQAIPDIFPIKDLVEPQQVIFEAPDGLKIHSQLFLPKGAKPGDNRPAVIFMHGGPIRQMLLGWHMIGYYHNAYALNQYLANKGYVALSVNYRSGIGYGRAFRTAQNRGPRGASEYQDIVASAKYLQSRPEVDPKKIGLWGGSYGGYLTALGLARDSELFAAGVDLHGVHDWSLRAQRRDGGGWGIQGEELMRQAYESSPVADVYFWTSPVLFIHGDDDRNVDFLQTTDLVQRLRKLGKAHVEVLVFPDEIHGFLRHDRWIEAYKAASDFFDRFLKEKKEK
mgnify:CR=1 FL=1